MVSTSALYGSVDSLAADRDRWELILTKLKSREMPPDDATIAPSDEQIDGARDVPRDRVRSRRRQHEARSWPRHARDGLNRAEYTNTIRDLLAIEFRADKNFPTDDSGEGFDNIGEILTVSPVLMEKYLSAAGRIAERAIAAEPLPKPIEVEYSLRFKNLRRLDPSNVEATHRFDFDADYELKIGLPGQRATDARAGDAGPVGGRQAGPYHAGRDEAVRDSSTSIPYSEERIRVPCPKAITRFGSGSSTIPSSRRSRRTTSTRTQSNKWIGSVTVIGPFATKGEKPSRKQILVCDPKTGPRCVDRILATLARRAYRRPVTRRRKSPR